MQLPASNAFNIDPTYGAVGFSPKEREEAFVHKHRVLAHEALMRIDAVGRVGAWRAARAYGRALMPMSDPKFLLTYRKAAALFARYYHNGKDPSEVIGSLIIRCDQEARRQGRLGPEESRISREDAGTGLVVGMDRLSPEELHIDETIVFDEKTKRVIISDSLRV